MKTSNAAEFDFPLLYTHTSLDLIDREREREARGYDDNDGACTALYSGEHDAHLRGRTRESFNQRVAP